MNSSEFGGSQRGIAPYASNPATSRGRLVTEEESASRDHFQRDRDRILHSSAFRRLKYKTQVFVYHEGDHFRTRLTHTLEVSQIARAMARMLGLNEDLTEALALAHDLGHPPFGHAGEDALNEVMGPFGGFDHNAQSLRAVTMLERRYATFDGLNLTWETLEGLVKHNGPLSGADIDGFIVQYNQRHDLDLVGFASLEAQIAAVSDDIAYNAHDIDDGLRAGLLELDDLREVPLAGAALAAVDARYPDLERARRIYEMSRRLITAMVDSVVSQTRLRIDAMEIASVDDVRLAGSPCAVFDPETAKGVQALKRFLFARVYRHERVNRIMADAAGIVRDLFTCYMSDETVLPDEWREGLRDLGEAARARHICDFVAGMTDRFALQEHARLFDATPKLR